MDILILVIEDTPETAELIKATLESEHYSVDIAYSGEEAIKKIEESSFKLILLDVMLPRVDGFELARRLKAGEKTKNIPIIGVTALDIPGIVNKCLKAGMDDVILKPFEIKKLIEKVGKYVKAA